MWIYIFLLCVPLVWAKTKDHYGIPKDFDSQDIKNVFFSHPNRDSKSSSTHGGGKLRKEDSDNEERFIAGKLSSTGWVTKCRGLECISTTTRNSAGNFLNKALDVLDKYTPQKSGKHRSRKKQDGKWSNSLATLLATTSGVIENQTSKSSKPKEPKTATKKSHENMDNVYVSDKKQNWYHATQNGIETNFPMLNRHHDGPSTLNTRGMQYHGPLEPRLLAPGLNNLGMHEHGFYQPHATIHKSIHVMDPSYGGMDHENTGNIGTIAHFHPQLPFPVIGPSAIHSHGHGHIHPPSFPFIGMNLPVIHHHVKFEQPAVHLNENPNMLLDGPVPPYPDIPIPGSLPGNHGLMVNHAPFPVSVSGPPRIQQFPVPVPVPVPGPTKIQRVPYQVPVPGPPEVHPVLVPVKSPPTFQNVPIPFPVQSPPIFHNVPFPVPVPVPSPPRIKEVPYPVRIPVKQPPIIQRFFYPVGVPQPGQVHHVPFPVYIRQPPEVQTYPYPVRIKSPPEKVPIPVPSEPEVVVQRVPYPVLVPQPGPLREVHHHHDHEHYVVTQNGRCDVNPCLNGGTCTAFQDSYRCHCQEGFKGVHCEEQSKCHPNPCRNLGSCTELVKGYECTCQPGHKGTNCDITDPCSPSPCKNGGTCAEVGNSFTCDCRIGWIGKSCGIEAKCLPINPCQNGGTCTEALGSYHCNCIPGWQGLSCEISAPDQPTDSFGQSKGGCNNCDPHAFCDGNKCVCSQGYLGDGYACDFVPHVMHDKRVTIKKIVHKKNHLTKLSNKKHQGAKTRSKKTRKALSIKQVVSTHS